MSDKIVEKIAEIIALVIYVAIITVIVSRFGAPHWAIAALDVLVIDLCASRRVLLKILDKHDSRTTK